MLYMSKSLVKLLMLACLPCATLANETNNVNSYFCGDALPEAENLDNVVPTLYSIVSGPAGAKHDWDMLRKLFAPEAKITPVFHDGSKPVIQSLTVDAFVSLNKELFKNQGFFETEVDSQVFSVGHMATVISLYESRQAPEAAPYSTGVNSFQLLNDGRRWCVVSVTWDSDKGGHVMPTRFNPGQTLQF